MKLKILLIVILVISASGVSAQLNKQQTLNYIFQVYQDNYFHKDNGAIELDCHYQTLVVKFKKYNITYSLKKPLKIFKIDDIHTGDPYWCIGSESECALNGITSEDACNKLYKALIHLQVLLKDDKDSKDPFDN